MLNRDSSLTLVSKSTLLVLSDVSNFDNPRSRSSVAIAMLGVGPSLMNISLANVVKSAD